MLHRTQLPPASNCAGQSTSKLSDSACWSQRSHRSAPRGLQETNVGAGPIPSVRRCSLAVAVRRRRAESARHRNVIRARHGPRRRALQRSVVDANRRVRLGDSTAGNVTGRAPCLGSASDRAGAGDADDRCPGRGACDSTVALGGIFTRSRPRGFFYLTSGQKMPDKLAPRSDWLHRQGIDRAVFELEIARMMSQIQVAADTVLNKPEAYQYLYSFFTRGCHQNAIRHVEEFGPLQHIHVGRRHHDRQREQPKAGRPAGWAPQQRARRAVAFRNPNQRHAGLSTFGLGRASRNRSQEALSRNEQPPR